MALNVRSQSFAFAVVEGPGQLLDWGAKSFRGGVNAVGVPAGKKVAALLTEYCPDVIVVKVASRARLRKPVVRAVKRVLNRSRCGTVRFIETQAVRRFFARSYKARSKYAVAAIIARHFPELAWKLPEISVRQQPKRKAEDTEDHRVFIFEAIAAALTWFATRRSRPKGEEAIPA